MKFTEAQMVFYVAEASRLQLNGWKMLTLHTPDQLLKLANGIGPESFSEIVTTFMDSVNPTLICASIIHDVRYTYGLGCKADFYQANADLEINGKICADDKYVWYNPCRYYVYVQAHKYKVICDDFGYRAYETAIEERKKDPELERIFAEINKYRF